MNDIAIIAPYKELYLLCKKIVNDYFYKDINVIFGDLSQGVEEAKKAVNRGTKIIISRGGTYKLIKEKVKIPVVEIKVSSFDLLKVFKAVSKYEGKIGVVGYENVIDKCEIIADMLNLDIVKIKIDNVENAERLVGECIQKGVRVFIGDTIGNKISSKYNCISYLIKSSEDSIINAIKEARRILQLSKVELERSERLRSIVDFVKDGIISIDENRKITLINETAKKILNLDNEIIGKTIDRALPNIRFDNIFKSHVPELGEILDIGNSKITLNKVPIIIDEKIKGIIITFSDVTELQKLEKLVRMKLSKKGFLAKYHFDNIIYSSEAIRLCIEKAKKYSVYDSPILITGETGVGKELFAQSIHNYSNRKNGPFVAINCAALPPNLVESELFGYVEGAFTGAMKKGKAGLFELAHGGTIFLDEISEMPLDLQGRLLRVLQEKEIMRIGDDKVIPVDVRIVCATNKDLKSLVEQGKFRKDLYYRINILSLHIPPLKDRSEDIKTLTLYFIKKYSIKYKKNIRKIDDSIFPYLENYDFKGNVRELEGIIERGVVLSSDSILKVSDLGTLEKESYNGNNYKNNTNKLSKNHFFSIQEDVNIQELVTRYIKYILNKYDGKMNEAARILGISRSTIWRKLKNK